MENLLGRALTTVQGRLIASSVKISVAVSCVCEDCGTRPARVPEQANVSAMQVA
jgi:hypothetical protein